MKNQALILAADGFEDSELLYPYYRLQEAGYGVDIAAPKAGPVTGKHGYVVTANLSLDDILPHASRGYKLLVVPGGKAPAALREIPKAPLVARDFAASGALIAAICHGPQLLIATGLLRGKRATCYETVADELKAAGVFYTDAEVVVDGKFITSRKPSDLPAFMREVMAKLEQ